MRFTNSLLSVHLSQTHTLDLFAIDGSSFVCQIKSDSFVVCARPRKPSEVKIVFDWWCWASEQHKCGFTWPLGLRKPLGDCPFPLIWASDVLEA